MVQINGNKVSSSSNNKQPLQNFFSPYERGDLRVKKELLKYSISDVNETDCDGYTPLIKACMKGNIKLTKLLLEHPDTQVNLANYAGWTPLHWACNMGHALIVELLLKHPDIQVNILSNLISNLECSPLHLACSNGNNYHEVLFHLLQNRTLSIPTDNETIQESFNTILQTTLETDQNLKNCAVLLYIRGFKPKDPENNNLHQNWIEYEQTKKESPSDGWNLNCAQSPTLNLTELCIFTIHKHRVDVTNFPSSLLIPPEPFSEILDDFIKKGGMKPSYNNSIKSKSIY